ncbi:hypothetical protein [Parolsenella catena]|uniref:hypothetical protein n=1 Tax=Parolsenella catena TaxID=2003188 RepID=UPI003AF1A134
MEDLRSGIERLKQAKAHMREANGIVSDCISQLKELEEENAGLRAKLEAFIQSDDSYMKLPLDADGVPIRIGDVVYGNPGIAWTVVGLRTSKLGWKVEMDNMPFLCEPDDLTHKKPDSWEKLEKDAMGRACELAGSGNLWCGDCEWGKEGIGCQAMARLEILKRAKKLAGIEEEAQR